MARTVNCIKLGREAEGLDFPPYPGDLGKRLYESVSKEAWAGWQRHQTMLINENRLTPIEPKARAMLSPTTSMTIVTIMPRRTMLWTMLREYDSPRWVHR